MAPGPLHPRAVDFVAVATRDDCPADFVVDGLIVRVFRCFGSRYLPRFMGVVRSGCAVVPVFLFFFHTGFGFVSFSLAEFAVELVFACFSFFRGVPFSVAPPALLRVWGGEGAWSGSFSNSLCWN